MARAAAQRREVAVAAAVADGTAPNGDVQDARFCSIQAHCALAQLAAQAAQGAADDTRHRELLNEAAQHVAAADALDMAKREQLVGLARGALALAARTPNVEKAQSEFDAARARRCNGRRSVAADVALGQVRAGGAALLNARLLGGEAAGLCGGQGGHRTLRQAAAGICS